MACGTQTPQAECWPHSMKRKSSSSLFQWTSWKENRRLLHTLLCRYVGIIPKRGLSILSVFSTVHQNEIPQPENHISLYLISCGLHLSEVHLAWCLISAFWFCKYMYCEHFPMCLGIRVALHLGYIALICCALCDWPTFAAFRPNSNATRWRSDLVWYVPHQYSFLEHDDM